MNILNFVKRQKLNTYKISLQCPQCLDGEICWISSTTKHINGKKITEYLSACTNCDNSMTLDEQYPRIISEPVR